MVRWAPVAALAVTLLLAWGNFLFTARWAALPGALNGVAPAVVRGGADCHDRADGHDAPAGRNAGADRTGRVGDRCCASGAAVLVAALFSRLPLSTWTQIPFKDDYTPLYQSAVNGVRLLQRGSVVGWNWWLLGGYPTSTDIAQSFGALAFIPMVIFGERVGYHVLHAVVFLAHPVVRLVGHPPGRSRGGDCVAAGFACLFTAGYFVTIGNSGDTNSLIGVFCAGIAMRRQPRRAPRTAMGRPGADARPHAGALFARGVLRLRRHLSAARGGVLPRREGRPAAGRRRRCFAVVVSLPVHWESLRYPAYVSFNNTVYDPGAPIDWSLFFRTLYYNVEILAFPHRWFNDYRSLANVWLPALIVMALAAGRSRAGFYACAVVLTQGLLRLNTSEAGAMFDRIQHMLPLIAGPALAGFVLRFAGTRRLAVALVALIGLYVATSFMPVRHVPDAARVRPAADRSDRRGRRQLDPRRDQPTPRHGQRSCAAQRDHAVRRRTSRGCCRASPGSASTARCGTAGSGTCFAARSSAPARLPDARSSETPPDDVRRRNAPLGRQASLRLDRRVAAVSRAQRIVRRALAERTVVGFRVSLASTRVRSSRRPAADA